MTLNPIKSPVLFSGLCGYFTLLAAACLPLWSARYIHPFVIVMEGHMYCDASIEVPDVSPSRSHLWAAWKDVRFAMTHETLGSVFRRHSSNLVLGAGILVVSTGMGRLFYW